MKVKIVLYIFFQFVYFISNGQDTELLKKYVYKQFEVSHNLQISYGAGDIELNPNTDEFSLKKINELKDSFQISGDISYLERIGEIYIGLHKIDTGMQYLREAAIKYQEILNDNPNDRELMKNLCQVHMKMGEFLPAIEFADRMIDINPRDSFAIFTNIFLHMIIGDFSGAKKYCEKAFDEFPENPITYLSKTTILVFEECFMRATSESFEGFKSDFSYLQKAADTYKNNPKMQLATLSGKLFVLFYQIMMPYVYNQPKSLKNFKFQLTKSDSLQLTLYKNQCLTMIEMTKYKNHYILYYSLGAIQFLKGDYNGAIDHFKQSIHIRKLVYNEEADVEGSYNNIMTCYLFMGDTLRAKKWTKMKIKDKVSYKSMPKNYIELAKYDLIKGHLHKGEKLLNKAIALDSTAHKAYIDLANIQMIRNNLKQAEKYLDKCFKIKPDCKELHESFILLTLFQGDIKTAKYLVNQYMDKARDNSFALDIERDFLK